ncbi:MAG TPA: DapH/DapD/GlmU-related protein [Aromatoleum sp.]|uniref:DapH/DapD/GlmU-related protein n=1 Tax=Aromatoleum sp. TaxID=2307007 RepID=UPI002B47E7B2|nr:DapH/DapD/GlmU-related protein [Aromatoleum sp.]HJV26877.1 DapH/DapD/GlmU-related protein [Aromatoleum sp.]
MRKITLAQSLCFLVLLFAACALGIGTTMLLVGGLPLGDFRGVTLVAAAIVLIYAFAIALHRTFLFFVPLRPGYLAPGSREEFAYHVYLLCYLVLFQPLTRGLFVPVPLMRVIYLALGARLGTNSYSAGTILDPPLTSVGDNCIIGHDAVMFSHAVEGDDLSLAPIVIGHNVTIGAKAVIQPGVVIEDGAIVAVNAVVSKGTHIAAGELWGGIPARRIREAGAGPDRRNSLRS